MNKNDNNPSEVKLKPIKLVVKKPTRSKKINNNQPNNKNERSIIEMFSSIKIILVIILLIASISLLVGIIKELDHKPETIKVTIFDSQPTGLLANWSTTSGYTFTFEDNDIFHIYESGKEIPNNYYEGTYTYVTKEEAISEMGYENEEEFKQNFKLENYDSIYSIHMQPQKYIKDDKNIINRKVDNNESWWYIIILIDNNNAIAYNKTLDIRYKLTRS